MAVSTLSDQDFQQALESHDKVIVKFYADWCGSCKLFAPKFKRLSSAEENQSVFFAEVNAEQNAAARKAAGVDNLPFIATFKNGQLLEGASTSKEEFVLGMLEKLKS